MNKVGTYGFQGRVLEIEGALKFLMALHEVRGLVLPIVPSVRRHLTDMLSNRAEAVWLTRMESSASGHFGESWTADERTRFAVAAGNAEAQWLNEMLDDADSPIQAIHQSSRERMNVHRLMVDTMESLGLKISFPGLGAVPGDMLDAEQVNRVGFICECLVHGLCPAPGGPWAAGGVEEKLDEWAREMAVSLGLGPPATHGIADQDQAVLALAEGDRDVIRSLPGVWFDLNLGGLPKIADTLGSTGNSSEPKSPPQTRKWMRRRRELVWECGEQIGVAFPETFGRARKPVLEAYDRGEDGNFPAAGESAADAESDAPTP